MERNGAKITPRQRRLIEALLTEKNITRACRAAGVGRTTHRRWMRQPHFVEALRQAEAELLEVSMRRLLSMQDVAVDALQALLNDTRLRPPDRLRAVQMVLDNVLRLRNAVELEARLAELEKQVKRVANQSEPPHTD